MENIITEQEKLAILDDMKRLLREYEYDFNTSSLEEIIHTWATNKADLIQRFKKHPNYVEGKFMIAFNKDWNRDCDKIAVRMFARWVHGNMEEIQSHLPAHVLEARKVEKENYWGSGSHYDSFVPFTLSTMFLYDNPEMMSHQYLDTDIARYFNGIDPSMRFKEGQKMSRAVNKVCCWLGIDKLPDYNKEFAKFADAINPLKIVRHTVISLNPIDYLTMSFGNSWASCHTIDKENYRNMPNSYEGQYSSGTISYMLDGVSMVFYTISADYNGDEYYFESKINRCMFHYGNNKLVQGRVYPQSNDCNSDGIYKDIREIVQKVIADCNEAPNYWTTKHGTSAIYDHVWTRGTHYADYTSFSNCCISFPKEMDIDTNRITIGHSPICIECGREHDTNDNINHCVSGETCENCGYHVSNEDVIWVGDYPYCSDCVTYCELCYDYEVNSECTYIRNEDRYVCNDCRDEYYTYCDVCEDWHRNRYVTWLERYDIEVCEDCLYNGEFTQCNECGEWFRNDDIAYFDDETEQNYCSDCWETIEKENEEEAV